MTTDHQRLFIQALYPHARLLRAALLLSDQGYFAADHDLVSGLSSVKSRRELALEIARFRYHPLNQGWLRNRLRLRVSTRRCRQLVADRLASGPPE